jgi:hypothetical protein
MMPTFSIPRADGNARRLLGMSCVLFYVGQQDGAKPPGSDEPARIALVLQA